MVRVNMHCRYVIGIVKFCNHCKLHVEITGTSQHMAKSHFFLNFFFLAEDCLFLVLSSVQFLTLPVFFLFVLPSIPVNFFYIRWPIYKAIALSCDQVEKIYSPSDLPLWQCLLFVDRFCTVYVRMFFGLKFSL